MNKNIKYTLAAMVFACWGNAMAQNPYGALWTATLSVIR